MCFKRLRSACAPTPLSVHRRFQATEGKSGRLGPLECSPCTAAKDFSVCSSSDLTVFCQRFVFLSLGARLLRHFSTDACSSRCTAENDIIPQIGSWKARMLFPQNLQPWSTRGHPSRPFWSLAGDQKGVCHELRLRHKADVRSARNNPQSTVEPTTADCGCRILGGFPSW
jgi:hypothetical protein